MDTMAAMLSTEQTPTHVTACNHQSKAAELATQAIFDGQSCCTIVNTVATLCQLHRVFQEPTSKIISLLSAQGDPSRDFLLLKGVAEHGLLKELDFRQRGSGKSALEIESRIQFLSKLLYTMVEKTEVEAARLTYKRKLSELLGLP